ncbi:hypothetical protein ScPMuIL_009768 [Solemya velum]
MKVENIKHTHYVICDGKLDPARSAFVYQSYVSEAYTFVTCHFTSRPLGNTYISYHLLWTLGKNLAYKRSAGVYLDLQASIFLDWEWRTKIFLE